MTITPTGSALQRVLDGEFHEIKQRWRDEVTTDDVVRDPTQSIDEARDWALDRVKRLAHRHFVTAGFPTAQGGTGDAFESPRPSRNQPIATSAGSHSSSHKASVAPTRPLRLPTSA